MGCFDRNDDGSKIKWDFTKRVKMSAVIDMIKTTYYNRKLKFVYYICGQVLAIVGITVSGIDLRRLNEIRLDNNKTIEEKNEAIRSIYLVGTILIINIIKLVMGYILWKGATLKESKKCKAWLTTSLILWLVHLADFIVQLAIGASALASTISTSLTLLFRLVPMTFVSLFIRQLSKEKENQYKPHGPPIMI